MIYLIASVSLALSVSFLCSLLESCVLSLRPSDIASVEFKLRGVSIGTDSNGADGFGVDINLYQINGGAGNDTLISGNAGVGDDLAGDRLAGRSGLDRFMVGADDVMLDFNDKFDELFGN